MSRKSVLEPAHRGVLKLPERPDKMISDADKDKLDRDLEELSHSRRIAEAELTLSRAAWED